jgi:hypothetical protein
MIRMGIFEPVGKGEGLFLEECSTKGPSQGRGYMKRKNRGR